MRDHDKRNTRFLRDLTHEFEHFRTRTRIQVARRLIRQHQTRLRNKRTHNRCALLLTTRHLRSLLVHLVIEADATQNHLRSLNIRLVRSALADTDRH